MEKRIGTISIFIHDTASAKEVNNLLSSYSMHILSRNGLPLSGRNLHIITIIIDAPMDTINALTGKLGRISHIEVKCNLAKLLQTKE